MTSLFLPTANRILPAILFILLLSPFPFPPQAKACDDTILALIRGDKPEDAFSKKLLEMGRKLRQAAGDIKAFDHLGAANRIKEVLKEWIRFDNQYVANPPLEAPKGEEWKSALASVSTALGELDEFAGNQKYAEAHDLIEPIVLRMSILSTLSPKNAPPRRLLDFELRVYEMKPGFRGKSGQPLLQEIRSTAGEFSELKALLPADVSTSTARFEEVLGDFLQEAESSGAVRSPGILSRFNTLLERFDVLKQALVKAGWFKLR